MRRPHTITKLLAVLLLVTYSMRSARAQSQQRIIDSCNLLLQKMPFDTNRINLMFYLGQELWFNRSIPEAIEILRQTLFLSDQKKYYIHAANARLILANAFMQTERYDSAFTYLEGAAQWAAQLKQHEHVPKIQQVYSTLYNLLGDPKNAFSYGLAAAAGYEKSNIPEINIQVVFAWLSIGKIFENQQQYDKALYYYNKALDKAKTATVNIDWYVHPAMLNIAGMYIKLNRLNEAKAIYNNIVAQGAVNTSVDNIVSSMRGLGNIAILEKDYPAAIIFYKEAFASAKTWNLKIIMEDCLAGEGQAFMLNHNYDSATIYLNKAIEHAEASGDNAIRADAYKYLSMISEQRQNFEQALTYERLYKSIADSIYNRNKITILNNLEVLYQTREKENQIISLKANNTEKELLLVKRSRMLLVTAIAVVCLLIILPLLYYNSRHKQLIAAQQQLLQQKKIDELVQQQQMVALQSMVAGQEAERARIARDLHDGLGGLFATVKMHLGILKHDYKELDDNPVFNKSYTLVNDAAEELRRIAHYMMPEVLVKLGLVQALRDVCTNINARGGINISLQAYGMDNRLQPEQEVIIFRIVQELITNIIKHARATEAIVQFNTNASHLHIIVEDNGSGFNLAENPARPHAGLDSIKSRVAYLKGHINFESAAGTGTTVTMEFNLLNQPNGNSINS